MEILRDPLGRDDFPNHTVLSIGNFDGFHIGHQTVISQAVARAGELGVPAGLMTFDPHPVKLLRPAQAPKLLTTIEQRIEVLTPSGLDVVAIVPFTHHVARMKAIDFIESVLVERFAVQEVYIGSNFRFGANREGDVDLLVEQGKRLGFSAEAWPTVELDGEVVSSTRVRKAVQSGDVEAAAQLLGRAVFGDGRVLVGKRLGRKLGFPTLNIELENELIPAEGVYVSAVYIPSFERVFPSVTNIGVRPTVYENSSVTIESHLMDFSADVYQERVRIFFLKRLRAEETFDSTLQLMAQVGRDVDATRMWHMIHPMDTLKLVHP